MICLVNLFPYLSESKCPHYETRLKQHLGGSFESAGFKAVGTGRLETERRGKSLRKACVQQRI